MFLGYGNEDQLDDINSWNPFLDLDKDNSCLVYIADCPSGMWKGMLASVQSKTRRFDRFNMIKQLALI